MTNTIRAIFFVLAGIFIIAQTPVQAQSANAINFNPNRILEDNDILNYNSLDLTAIQDFLNFKNGILKNYSTENAYGEVKSAAEIIYNAARNNYDCTGVTLSEQSSEEERRLKCRTITTVNPQLLLVLLQKEASLIEDPNPSQGRLDAATGYGCPTGQSCNPYWKGFGKQVNSAALQFLAYMQSPARYGFKVGETYIAKDRFSKLQTPAQAMALAVSHPHSYANIIASPEMVTVKPENLATAALYNYTPHVYNGNYNTYLLWDRYFGAPNNQAPPTNNSSRIYPNGSLIKATNDPMVWFISNGQKRHIANWSTFISRFRPEQIVTVSATELNNYPTGAQMKFPNYSLVQTPDQQIYLLVDKEKRPFANADVFKQLGFNPIELEQANPEDIADYSLGQTINASAAYVTGALLQDNKSGEIYYVENSVKHLVSPEIIDVKFPNKNIIKKSSTELRQYADGAPVLLGDGTLVKTPHFPMVYLISDGKKRPFVNEADFEKFGYNPNSVLTLSSQFLYNYGMGAAIN